MKHESFPAAFIFTHKMDTATLNGLYDGDFPYVEEIFASTLMHLDGDLDAVEAAFAGGMMEDLRKAVHKVKPTFGYTGLLAVQAACQQFETSCQSAASFDILKSEYQHLKHTLLDARDIIQTEYYRLKSYNAQ